MRITVFHNTIAPYRHGVFQSLASLAEVKVLFAKPVTGDRSWPAAVPKMYDYPHRMLRGRSVIWRGREVTVCADLLRALKSSAPDVVFSVFTRSNVLDVLRLARFCRRQAIPLVLWVGNVEAKAGNRGPASWASKAADNLLAKALTSADALVLYSELSADWLRHHFPKYHGRVLIGGQVLEHNDNHSPRINTNSQPRVRLLFVGKCEFRKGFDLLVNTLARLPRAVREETELTVVGDGPQLHLCARLGGAVRRMGVTPREALWPIYADHDLVVVPSRWDPWAFVVNESFSMGTPVLCSRWAGAAGLASKAGWIADPLDQIDFDRTLQRAIATCRQSQLRRNAVEAEQVLRPRTFTAELHRLFAELAYEGPHLPDRS